MNKITEIDITIPRSRMERFDCPIHGHQSYETFQRPDGTWCAPYCPQCMRLARESESALARIQEEAKERAVELERALLCPRPMDFDGPTFANFKPETEEEARNLRICKRFAERFSEREVEREKAHDAQSQDWRQKNSVGLLLFGNYGTGKTHLAYSILKELDRQGIPGFYITVVDLIDRLSDRRRVIDTSTVLTKLALVACLVLDEVGVQDGSEYEKKRLYQIIDGRIKNGRPTILITNLDQSELIDLLTQRVTDRINESTVRLMFTGRSRRKSKKAETAEEVF